MTLRARSEEEVDVVVVGAGAAGLSAALALEGARVLVLTPEAPGVAGATPLAQGGIAAALGADDDWREHARDTRAVGAGLVDEHAAEALVAAGPEVVARLVQLGVDFDRDGGGALALGLEAAHSKRRIVHVRDETGRAVARALAAAVGRAPHVEVRATRVEALGVDGRGVAGVLATDENGRSSFLAARAVVLASGGLGALYPATTNPPGALGEGLACAAEHGAELADLEFVQFHPTALDVEARPLPLLSEALRGAGARLCDERAHPLLAGEHPLGDLAPRDVVARALFRRQREGRRCYLDVREVVEVLGERALPALVAACHAFGLDPRAELLPVKPAAHYHMGGVATDLEGRTSLPGLFACGEVAVTGVHGANRLASNSLLEALAFGVRVATALPRAGRDAFASVVELPARVASPRESALDERAERDVQLLLGSYAGVLRHGRGLICALARLDELARSPALGSRVRAHALAGFCIAAAAEGRRESRGAHYREDFPDESPAFAVRSRTTLEALRESAGLRRQPARHATSSSPPSTPSRFASR